MADVVHISDHADAAKARLARIVRLPRFLAFVGMQAERMQWLEDVLFNILSQRSIDNAEGAQLDVYGRILGQPRDGTPDGEYRLRLKARARILRSSGTTEDIIAVFYAVVPEAHILNLPQYPAGLTLQIDDYPTPSAYVAAYADFLLDASSDGVRVIFQWQQGETEDTFMTGQTTALEGDHLMNMTTVVCQSTEGFPQAGSIIIDEGLADEETVTYTALHPTQFENCSPLSFNHDDRAYIAMVGSDGLGFDDYNDPGDGGELAGMIAP